VPAEYFVVHVVTRCCGALPKGRSNVRASPCVLASLLPGAIHAPWVMVTFDVSPLCLCIFAGYSVHRHSVIPVFNECTG